MKRIGIVLVLSAVALSGATAQASVEESFDAGNLVLRNAEIAKELRSRAARLGTSSASTDTAWIGYTPSAVSASNWWGVHAGFGKDGYYRPVNGQPHKGTWNWESPVHGDSLQGWWPLILVNANTGGQTRTDRNRPWWAIDIGNQANYVINQANGRTFGVVGVWHRDGGALAPAPAGLPSPEWTPAQGSHAAWMGVRAHGDATYSDPITGNPFNEDVLMFTGFGSISSGGNDAGYPGYGSQMDQMLYRDIDLAAIGGQSLTIRFRFRTVMSAGAGTTASTRTGWYDSDPLGVTGGPSNPQPNNFISSSDAGDALAPRDSFMVYLGRGIEGSSWTPAAANFAQNYPARPVYDPQRRWFGEVLRWDRDPNSSPSNPQPLHYRELLSVGGNWPAGADTANAGWVDTSFTISSAALQPMLEDDRVRLVFRVKTNRGFDDQGSSYSSNQRGAAVVDAVSYRIGAGPEVVFGDFESASAIDNATGVSAVDAWKSTGKPPGILQHAHAFADLTYEDICGQKGDVSRICNMSGVVISIGDHDAGEASGGLVSGTAQREVRDGIASPVIQLCGPFDGPGGVNRHGLGAPGSGPGDVIASEDYYIWYDIYTALFDPFTKGNTWIYACQSYPGDSKDPDGAGPQQPYPAWGQMRFPGITIFNPDPQCLIDFEPLKQQAVIKTSNASGIPDSIRIFLVRNQQCFRFGISSCSFTDGAYWDNVSLAVVDGQPAGITADIWHWLHDAFPANEAAGLPASANFDTAAAHVKTGLNTAQSTSNNLRFSVPGDSVVVWTSNEMRRVDLVFRILPGPGNYEPKGRPDVGTIVKRPDSRAVVTPGDGSFWDQYRQIPGDFASPGASVLHAGYIGGWNPNVWNSARCDTAEANLFARHTGTGVGNVLGGPADASAYMSTYHEDDPHYATLGIVHNRCFVATAGSTPTDIVCNGTVPSYVSSRPEHVDVTGTTREGTKILPDGLLTPGAHVEYFFRAQTSVTPGPMSAMVPDTNVVMQLATEGSSDGHRWQQFGVLPNAWKKPNYFHPVAMQFGTGPACLLVVDNNDRRGNERVWVGIADTIAATPQRFWGAHNGWHAIGNGDIDDPADNRRGSDGQPGFVVEHLGQPGSGSRWDMYQVKASESLTTPANTIGSRKANRTGGAGQQLVIDKTSRIGPTPEMLNTLYPMMMFLSGDLSSGVLGPFTNRSSNDAGILIEWLNGGSSSFQDRAFWAMGDGFVESNIFGQKVITTDLMLSYLGTDLVHWSYIQHTGNTEQLARLRLLPGWQNKGSSEVLLHGVRNQCTWTNDVLVPGGVGLPTLAQAASEYDGQTSPGGPNLQPSSVFKDWAVTSPYKTLVDGFDIEHLTSFGDTDTWGRSGYFWKIFTNVWSKLCDLLPPVSGVPPDAEALVDFARFANNPLRSGSASVLLGLARADRVEAKVYDISGRLIRTLADRRFPAGEHTLTWDGLDNAGRPVPRGVYFTQIRYREGGFQAQRKLTVLK